ncbi:LrgA, probably exported murein hydrolase [gamma proteobacterium HdN1]|nr:LrgA, probably exported murein hydrolase [gamma proteobacterium HdN1]
MLKGFAVLLAFQCVGWGISQAFHLPVPGPVLGMLLLLIYALVFTPSDDIQAICTQLLKYLPLFILPASVGIIDFGPLLRAEWLPVTLALTISLVISFWVTPLLFRFFSRIFGA